MGTPDYPLLNCSLRAQVPLIDLTHKEFINTLLQDLRETIMAIDCYITFIDYLVYEFNYWKSDGDTIELVLITFQEAY